MTRRALHQMVTPTPRNARPMAYTADRGWHYLDGIEAAVITELVHRLEQDEAQPQAVGA